MTPPLATPVKVAAVPVPPETVYVPDVHPLVPLFVIVCEPLATVANKSGFSSTCGNPSRKVKFTAPLAGWFKYTNGRI